MNDLFLRFICRVIFCHLFIFTHFFYVSYTNQQKNNSTGILRWQCSNLIFYTASVNKYRRPEDRRGAKIKLILMVSAESQPSGSFQLFVDVVFLLTVLPIFLWDFQSFKLIDGRTSSRRCLASFFFIASGID